MTVSHEGLLEWINEPQTRPKIMPDDLRVNPRTGSKLEMQGEHRLNASDVKYDYGREGVKPFPKQILLGWPRG